jgi:hypothetical protein
VDAGKKLRAVSCGTANPFQRIAPRAENEEVSSKRYSGNRGGEKRALRTKPLASSLPAARRDFPASVSARLRP